MPVTTRKRKADPAPAPAEEAAEEAAAEEAPTEKKAKEAGVVIEACKS